MAFVKVRVPRTSQPQDVCGLDPAWQRRGVKAFATPFATARPGKADLPLARIGTVPPGYGPSGVSWDLATTGNSLTFDPGDKHSTGSWASGTILVSFRWRNTAANGVIFCQATSTFFTPYYVWTIGRWGNGSLRVMCGGDVFASGTKYLVDGADYTVAITVGGYNNLAGKVYINGVFAGSAAPSSPVESTQNPTLGTLPTSSGYEYNGQIYGAAIIDALLEDAEVKSLSENPWQIFEPEELTIWMPDAVGAGGGTTQVTSDLSSSYAVQGFVAQDLAASYPIRAASSQDLSAAYTVQGAALASLDAAYPIRSAATQDLSAAYAVRGATQIDLSSLYAVRGAVQADATAAYPVRGAVSADLAASYDIQSAGVVVADLSASYAISGIAAVDMPGAYSVRGLATADLAGAYPVRASVQRDLSASYAVAGAVSAVTADLVASYAIEGVAGSGPSAAEIAAAVWGYTQ